MNTRALLIVLSAGMITTLMVNCENDEPNQDIDPCPGWPCFKVGNEWEYGNLSHKWCNIADSIIEMYDHHYLRILSYEMNDTIKNISYYYVRCVGDSVFWGFKYHYNGEWIRWVYNAAEGTKWSIIVHNYEKDTDDTVAVTTIEETKVPTDWNFNDGRTFTAYRYSTDLGGGHITGEVFSKDIGLIDYYSNMGGGYTLTAATIGNRKLELNSNKLGEGK